MTENCKIPSHILFIPFGMTVDFQVALVAMTVGDLCATTEHRDISHLEHYKMNMLISSTRIIPLCNGSSA
ncbi:hypothetical protein T06_4546 [Trichinella sp. T6]|nr:hypothetical protein T06_4546 [Trichinella sp. T6]